MNEARDGHGDRGRVRWTSVITDRRRHRRIAAGRRAATMLLCDASPCHIRTAMLSMLFLLAFSQRTALAESFLDQLAACAADAVPDSGASSVECCITELDSTAPCAQLQPGEALVALRMLVDASSTMPSTAAPDGPPRPIEREEWVSVEHLFQHHSHQAWPLIVPGPRTGGEPFNGSVRTATSECAGAWRGADVGMPLARRVGELWCLRSVHIEEHCGST